MSHEGLRSAGPNLDGEGRRLLDDVFDKWSLLVLATLCEGPRRFHELQKGLPGVTAKSLTACLRRLQRNGLIDRILMSEQPVAVRYEITPLGRSLKEPVRLMLGWTESNVEAVKAARLRFDDVRTPRFGSA